MRGKLLSWLAAMPDARITPARAGKTRSGRTAEPPRADHPRACGENLGEVQAAAMAAGSPPRVRGKPDEADLMTGIGRITPARAGKTAKPRACCNRKKDHPRACGENAIVPRPKRLRMGSPPRVRGKPGVDLKTSSRMRITPARAGKTPVQPLPLVFPPDHPRACGENQFPRKFVDFGKGSPPRVRGKLDAGAVEDGCKRITPARAGKTHDIERKRRLCGDHPRACGENSANALIESPFTGSPPRVRGKLVGMRLSCPTKGITPARAGKTRLPC